VRLPILAATCALAFTLPASAAELPGKALAIVKCAQCHGRDGMAIVRDAPNLAGQGAVYLRTQLFAFREGRRIHKQMNDVAAQLGDDDIFALAEWFAAIKVSVEAPD
jgi:cytochrome c553